MTNTIDFRTASFQAIFDASTRGIIAQGGPAHEAGNCMYRQETDDGVRKCALGQCIPDELYNEKIEGQGARGAVGMLELSISSVKLAFLEQLQSAHDGAAEDNTGPDEEVTEHFWFDWKKKLEEVADIFNLDKSVLEEIPVTETA